MENVNTVTILVDEYFELRQKATMNEFLLKELGELRGRIEEMSSEYWTLEGDVKFLIGKVGT
jgi:hypothetical protein